MKNPFKPGDTKEYITKVTEEKLARFESGLVHPVYATFALAQDAEWCCRLFVLDMLEEGEEGIGTFVSVHHEAPAPLGATIRFVATLMYVKGNTVHCRYEAFFKNTRIAFGEQTQKIIHKATFQKRLSLLKP